VLLPDRDDTYSALRYEEAGFVLLAPGLDDALSASTQRLIDLVGLNRIKGRDGYSGNDDLWPRRKKAWQTAQRFLAKYLQGRCDIETVIELATAAGFWSVWMQVFSEQNAVQDALVAAFPGTRKTLF